MSKFKPKGEDVLREETIKSGLDPEKDKDAIDKIVATRLQDEKVKGSLHEQKVKKAKLAAKSQIL